MPDWELFQNDDQKKLRKIVSRKYKIALTVTLLWTIPLMFIAPYIPGKRGRPSMNESMGYWNAVVLFSVIWLILIGIVAVYNLFRAENDYDAVSDHFKIEKISGIVKRVRRPLLDLDYATVTVEPFNTYLIDRNAARDLRSGETVTMRVEVKTKTVLEILK